MKHFSSLLLLFLLSSSPLLTSCTTTPANTPEKPTAATPIKIGFIGPLTGDTAILGNDILHGAEMKREEINANEGINGRAVELIVEDGRCNGSDGAAAVQKLIHVDKVVAIHGAECSAETLAAAPIAENAGIVLLSPASSNPTITDAGDFIFRMFPSDALRTKAMARYFKEEGFTNVAILTENSDFTVGFRDALKNDLGDIAPVFDELVEPGTKDFRTLFTRLQNETFDIIVLNLNSPANVAVALKQLREQGLTQRAISHEFGDNIDVLEIAGEAAEGFQIINVPTIDAETPFGQKFIAAYGQPQANLSWAGYGYDVLGILAQAIENAGTDGAAIRDYLYAMPVYEGVIADVSFDANGDVIGIPYALKEVRNGAFEKIADISVE